MCGAFPRSIARRISWELCLVYRVWALESHTFILCWGTLKGLGLKGTIMKSMSIIFPPGDFKAKEFSEWGGGCFGAALWWLAVPPEHLSAIPLYFCLLRSYRPANLVNLRDLFFTFRGVVWAP